MRDRKRWHSYLGPFSPASEQETATFFHLWSFFHLNTFQISGRLILSASEALSWLRVVKVSQEVSVKAKWAQIWKRHTISLPCHCSPAVAISCFAPRSSSGKPGSYLCRWLELCLSLSWTAWARQCPRSVPVLGGTNRNNSTSEELHEAESQIWQHKFSGKTTLEQKLSISAL